MAISIPEDFLQDDIPSVNPMTTGLYELVIMQHSWERYSNPNLNDKFYLLIEFMVSSGDYEGEKVFARFNLYHPNPKAQFFSWKSLKQLAVSLGQDYSDSKEIEIDFIDGGKCKAWIEVGHHEKYGAQYDPKDFYSVDYNPQKKEEPKVQKAAVSNTDDDLPW